MESNRRQSETLKLTCQHWLIHRYKTVFVGFACSLQDAILSGARLVSKLESHSLKFRVLDSSTRPVCRLFLVYHLYLVFSVVLTFSAILSLFLLSVLFFLILFYTHAFYSSMLNSLVAFLQRATHSLC